MFYSVPRLGPVKMLTSTTTQLLDPVFSGHQENFLPPTDQVLFLYIYKLVRFRDQVGEADIKKYCTSGVLPIGTSGVLPRLPVTFYPDWDQ